MLAHLLATQRLSAIAWIIIAALEVLAAVAVHLGGVGARYPRFRTYIYFSAAQSVLLMVFSEKLYSAVYYPVVLLQSAVLFRAVIELYSKTIGPSIAIPKFIPRRIAIWCLAGCILGAVVALAFIPQYRAAFPRVMSTLQHFAVIASTAVLWVMVRFMRKLRMPWVDRDREITLGLLLMLTSSSIAIAFMHLGIVWPAYRVVQLANVFSFGWWTWSLSGSPQVNENITLEEVAAVLGRTRENAHAVAISNTKVAQVVE